MLIIALILSGLMPLAADWIVFLRREAGGQNGRGQSGTGDHCRFLGVSQPTRGAPAPPVCAGRSSAVCASQCGPSLFLWLSCAATLVAD